MQAVLLEIQRNIRAEIRIVLNSATPFGSSFHDSSIARIAKSSSVTVLEVGRHPAATWDTIDKPDLLLTCSDSTSPNHEFSRQIVEQASILDVSTIGIQHGYECLGILHHTSQDNDYPWGVELSTDYVATWQPIDMLTSVSPFTKSRFIPCGPISDFARLANLLRRTNSPSPTPKIFDKPKRILICDNSHSPRFRISGRRESFFEFCSSLSKVKDLDIYTRRHPANKFPVTSSFSFKTVEGELTPFALKKFDMLISPPSSIIIDGSIAGIPTAVWSDFLITNDTINYEPLPVVTTARQVEDLAHNKCSLLKILCRNFIDANLAAVYGGNMLINVINNIK